MEVSEGWWVRESLLRQSRSVRFGSAGPRLPQRARSRRTEQRGYLPNVFKKTPSPPLPAAPAAPSGLSGTPESLPGRPPLHAPSGTQRAAARPEDAHRQHFLSPSAVLPAALLSNWLPCELPWRLGRWGHHGGRCTRCPAAWPRCLGCKAPHGAGDNMWRLKGLLGRGKGSRVGEAAEPAHTAQKPGPEEKVATMVGGARAVGRGIRWGRSCRLESTYRGVVGA